MRNVIVPLSAGAAPPRGHTAGLLPSVVAFSALLGCFPLGDLSAYSSGDPDNTGGAGEQPNEPDLGAGPGGAGSTPPLTSGGGTTSQETPGSDTPLDPNASTNGGSGNVISGGACSSDCPDADAGTIADAATPSLPEAGPPEVPPPPACALGEQTGPNGRCYVAVDTLLSWDAARINCQSRGADWDLATIRTSAQSVFIRSLLTREVWAGGGDVVTEGTWAWVTDGFEFWQGEGAEGAALNGAFVNWFEDEPNGGDSSDCLRLLIDSTWADLECTELRGSLCEGPPT